MLPFSVWRKVLRIQWVSENSEAVRFLTGAFYLLLALYRCRRFRDFNRLQRLYFKMIDSFAQYGRSEARDTMDRLLEIPWFDQHRQNVYRMISAHKQVVEEISSTNGCPPTPSRQIEMNRHVEEFVRCTKLLMQFDENDEARIRGLVENPENMDALLDAIYRELGEERERTVHQSTGKLVRERQL
jgi:hypothetical protein